MEKDQNDLLGDKDETENIGTFKDEHTEDKEEDMRDDTDDILTDKITNEETEEEVNKEHTEGVNNTDEYHENQVENDLSERSDGTKDVGELEPLNTTDLDKGQEVCDEAPPVYDPEREKREKERKAMTNYENLAFPKRPKSMIKSELLVKDVKKFIEDMKKQTAPEDLDVRIIPSNMACRFELPIDLTRLKGECPLSYLKKYCRVTDSRQTVYKEKFDHYSLEQTITVSDLRKIYESLFHESALRDEVMHLQRLLGLDLSMELDVETFTVVSCLIERIMLKSQGRGPAQGYKKNIFEVTNFSALNGKLQGIDISPQMMNLLKYIRGT